METGHNPKLVQAPYVPHVIGNKIFKGVSDIFRKRIATALLDALIVACETRNMKIERGRSRVSIAERRRILIDETRLNPR